VKPPRQKKDLAECALPFSSKPAAESASRLYTDVPAADLSAATALAGWRRVTLLYMKRGTLTLRLDEELERDLDNLAKQTGRTRSDLARDALRRQLSLLRFERLRNRVLPFAEARGLLTDEDVFAAVS
jgi:predicted transcriptional regulator